MFTGAIEGWDLEADFVVLGTGVAGTVAAMTAYDEDPSAKIVILEKQPEAKAGGNSRAAGGDVLCPTDIDEAIAFRRAIDEPNPPPDDVIQAWAEEIVQLKPWLGQHARESGLEFRAHGGPTVAGPGERIRTPIPAWMQETSLMPGADMEQYKGEVAPRPSSVWRTFYRQVQNRPIEILYETPAVEFVQDANTGAVRGVVAQRDGAQFLVKARRAVALCTGGFQNNMQMQRDFGGLTEVYPVGNPANTGDGIKMLLKAGADLWHMRNSTHLGGLGHGIKVPDFDAVFARNPRFAAGASSWIDIAKDGERFYDEGRIYSSDHHKRRVNGAWIDELLPFVLPVHMLFDENARQAEMLGSNFMGWNFAVENYRWSDDNLAEIQRGWIAKADTIGELAEKIGRDRGRLEQTVSRFNEYAAAGNDPDFGRLPRSMVPIDTPPFYGVRIVPYLPVTTGGGRRNGRAQVLDPDGAPIPHLYEAGELGASYGNLFHYGCTLAEAMIFGRIAGRNAIKEKAWDEEPALERVTRGRSS